MVIKRVDKYRRDVKYGTAQGSIFGLIEYIIYVNNIVRMIKKIQCTDLLLIQIVSAYADLKVVQLNL